MNPLQELHKAGQSVWLDFITRRFITEGKLKALIDNDGLRGVTSNPTIFQKAITGGNEYDDQINALIRKDKANKDIFDELSVQDIQQACDQFRPVYDKSDGRDGFVSLEVNPLLARDTRSTLEEARRLFKWVARPNVMIKIPATSEGLPAIEQALGEGININITLIFALERYAEVIEAWLKGLEHLAQSGKPLDRVASVASFFVSRVDSLVDSLLDKKIAEGQDSSRQELEALKGKAAIANARIAYQMFLKTTFSERFKKLGAKGANVQRPLWASTSTKNPKYRDVLYVEELIGPDTVNTLPPATIDAFRDHGRVRNSIVEEPQKNEQTLAALAAVGIDIKQVTRQLEEEGVHSFSESYDSLIKSLDQKRQALKVAR
jgi:transaldolase